MLFLADHILWQVFSVCFIGATIFPLPTEAALLWGLSAGEPMFTIWAVASLGNCLGASTNYFLGQFFSERIHRSLVQSRSGRKALAWYGRYGGWSMLVSWLPFVGDPLCLAAGLFRLSWGWYALGLLTRAIRYAVVLWMASAAHF